MRHRFARPYDFVARNALAPRARQMRLGPTRSEEILWSALRASQLGVRFRRQVVLSPCIVDFFASAVRLIVEVDGAVHLTRALADATRDAAFDGNGLRTVRVTAELIEQSIANAIVIIRLHLTR